MWQQVLPRDLPETPRRIRALSRCAASSTKRESSVVFIGVRHKRRRDRARPRASGPCSVASAIAFESSRKFSAREVCSRLSCCSTQCEIAGAIEHAFDQLRGRQVSRNLPADASINFAERIQALANFLACREFAGANHFPQAICRFPSRGLRARPLWLRRSRAAARSARAEAPHHRRDERAAARRPAHFELRRVRKS